MRTSRPSSENSSPRKQQNSSPRAAARIHRRKPVAWQTGPSWSRGPRASAGLGSSYPPAERSVLSTRTRGTPRLYRRLQEEGPDKNPPSGALGVVGGGKAETKARMSPESFRRSRKGEQGEAGRWGKDQGSRLGFFRGSLHTNPSGDVCCEPLPPAITILHSTRSVSLPEAKLFKLVLLHLLYAPVRVSLFSSSLPCSRTASLIEKHPQG